MKSTLLRGVAVSAAAALAAAVYSPVASAQAATAATTGTTYQVTLTQQNKSNASGTATVKVNGNNVTVTIQGNGFSPNVAHLAHLHIGGQATCPAATADANKDGYVDVKEAEPFVGPMRVTLSTSGDTSASSALAADRAPKADAKGALTYNRTFTLPTNVKAADLAKASVDIHGITTLFGDKAKYDGDKKSELDNKVAFETTAPAACGVLSTAPTGGTATGVGSVDGIESPALFVAGVTAIFAAVIAAIIARKQLNGSSS
jgi:Cu/Zn superoxide dismutase